MSNKIIPPGNSPYTVTSHPGNLDQHRVGAHPLKDAISDLAQTMMTKLGLENKRDVSSMPYCTFSETNETLDFIIQGLKPEASDNILCIAGSGDQPIALAQYSDNILAIDNETPQIKMMNHKIQLLKDKQYDQFCNLSSDYFKTADLERIRENLGAIKPLCADIFNIFYVQEFNKIYLSNAGTYGLGSNTIGVGESNHELFISRLFQMNFMCKKGGVIYSVGPDRELAGFLESQWQPTGFEKKEARYSWVARTYKKN